MGQPVVLFEISYRDTLRTQQFYAQLLGWQMQAAGPAVMIETGAQNGIQATLSRRVTSRIAS